MEQLRLLRDESVQCCVTSPPYWNLRDYNTGKWEGGNPDCDHSEARLRSRFERGFKPGDKQVTNVGSDGTEARWANECPTCGASKVDLQIGLEETPEQYVENLVQIFREVRRVLRHDGTLWLNLGDSYYNYRPGGVSQCKQTLANHTGAVVESSSKRNFKFEGIKEKDLVGIPWMTAFALRADGWYLRSDIIWSKPNPMPESVRDRCTKAHEYMFLLTKNSRYFYDADAIREKPTGRTDPMRFWKRGMENCANGQRNDAERTMDLDGIHGRNKRSVWTVTTKPYPEAHFATFPPDLIKPCILAGTSEKGGCVKCGAPYKRSVETEYLRHEKWFGEKQAVRHSRGSAGTSYNEPVGSKTKGWEPTCDCNADIVPCVVLDCFAGSFTTCAVALELGRNAIGIELNPEYVKLGQKRCSQVDINILV